MHCIQLVDFPQVSSNEGYVELIDKYKYWFVINPFCSTPGTISTYM